MLNLELNEILHQANRTKIMTYLLGYGKTDYTQLKKKLELSDGQMTTHMRVLLSNHYVEQTKFFEQNKPKTVYEVSQLGREEFLRYLANLKQILLHTQME
jgi:predicted ArsR family transcriptional regulator